jgi:hypothetical protein
LRHELLDSLRFKHKKRGHYAPFLLQVEAINKMIMRL